MTPSLNPAREKFQKGDRVQQNADCPRSARLKRDGVFHQGTVIGFGREGDTVHVRFDHRKTVETYHMDFLDKVSP
jgi:hypothetical protein